MEVTIEKDEFTGFKKIFSPNIGLRSSMGYQVGTIGQDDFFELLYLEGENGQGALVIRIHSYISNHSINKEWPHWDDNFFLIIDGERQILSSKVSNSFETKSEMKIYDLPMDVFGKICNAREVKYSLRGKHSNIEGVFSDIQLSVFKGFEKYCFGDENEGKEIFDSIPNIAETWTCFSCKTENVVPSNSDSFNCRICGKANSITRPSNASDEEKMEQVLLLLKDNKVSDAIKYYAFNYGVTEQEANKKIKTLAEENGHGETYKKHERKNGIIALVVLGVIVFLIFKACS
ncbi:MAG: hypothetical protein ACK5EK_01315 [Flavobacteriia bacterium]|jgi:hypothetical protein